MPIINRPPTNTNNDDEHYKTLAEIQTEADKNYDTLRNYNSIPIGSTAAVQREDDRFDMFHGQTGHICVKHER